jgi:hypothetical protein
MPVLLVHTFIDRSYVSGHVLTSRCSCDWLLAASRYTCCSDEKESGGGRTWQEGRAEGRASQGSEDDGSPTFRVSAPRSPGEVGEGEEALASQRSYSAVSCHPVGQLPALIDALSLFILRPDPLSDSPLICYQCGLDRARR